MLDIIKNAKFVIQNFNQNTKIDAKDIYYNFYLYVHHKLQKIV